MLYINYLIDYYMIYNIIELVVRVIMILFYRLIIIVIKILLFVGSINNECLYGSFAYFIQKTNTDLSILFLII
jgi:hypothetical protein